MSSDVFFPNDIKRKSNTRYSNWRDAAYEDKPVNNNSSWRTDPIYDSISKSTDVFKILVKTRKLANQNNNDANVRQAGIQTLTNQEIKERIERQEIIQQDVKNGTYSNPDKIYNRLPYDYVTYGDRGMNWSPPTTANSTATITTAPNIRNRTYTMTTYTQRSSRRRSTE